MGFAVSISRDGISLSSHFPWKISIVSFMAYPEMTQGKPDSWSYLQRILQDQFFDAVEVPSLSSADWNKVKEQLGRKKVARGLQPDILTGKLDMNALDEARRQDAVSRIRSEIDLANSRGIGMIGICSGPDPGVAKRKEAAEKLVQSLIEICQYASQKQVKVALETFDREYDKKLLIGPLDEAIQVLRKVREKCDNIGLMWDLSHAPMLSEAPEDVRRAAGFLAHIHAGCSKKTNGAFLDTHPGFHTKGAVNSELDLARLLQVLLEIGYEGMVGFEVKPEPDQTGDEIVATAKGVLIGAYQRVVSDSLKK